MQNEDLIRTLATGLEAGEQIEELKELVKMLTGLVGEIQSGRIALSAKTLAHAISISERSASAAIATDMFPPVWFGGRKLVLCEDVLTSLRKMQSIDRDQYMPPGDKDRRWMHNLAVLLQGRRERASQ
jgi:hypothetical protein